MNSLYVNQSYSPDKVLLIHNGVSTLEAMQRYLEANSFQVDCVLEAEQAKLLMDVLPYSTVIIDRSLFQDSTDDDDITSYLTQWHPTTHIMVVDMAESVEVVNKFLPQTPVTAH